MCPFDPELDRASRTITLRIPRDCFPALNQMRARALVVSTRRKDSVDWFAKDTSRWTDFARPGETATVTDPAVP